MKSKQITAALAASLALAFGSAHAAPDPAETAEVPVIILELTPASPDGQVSEQEQAALTMLLMQLLGAMQAEGENVEVQFVKPTQGLSI